MKVVVNDDCTACGTCASLCEDVFDLKDDKAIVKKSADLEANKECIEQAIEACPAEAISIVEEKNK